MAGKTAAAIVAALAKAQRQKNNENTVSHFAIAIAALMGLFSIFHWMDVTLQQQRFRNNGPKTNAILCISRRTRAVLLHKTPGFPSIGHAVVFIFYITINVSLSFTNMNWATLNNWAKRLGWIAASNLTLVTFLALKNTPLAFLTSYSYERLRVFHAAAGYTLIVWSLLHAVTYIAAWTKSGSLHELLEISQIMGIVAGLAMLATLVATLLLRRLRYELFYIFHVVMLILIVIVLGFHRPDISTKTLVVIIFAAAIWISDRLLRTGRIAFYALGNTATITPLPLGSVRIVLKRTSRRAVPGSHVFLWLPAIRSLETHPFTIASANPFELVVKAHDGFTKDLLAHATANPGAILRASVDRPYGTLPNFVAFEHVVLIAGGSGASFTFGIAVELLRKIEAACNPVSKHAICFIWIVRQEESLTHFSSQLAIIAASSVVSLHIHTTHSFAPSIFTDTLSSSAPSLPSPASEEMKPMPFPADNILPASDPEKRGNVLDVEKAPQVKSRSASLSSSLVPEGVAVRPKRPDIHALIKGVFDEAENDEKVLVAACGPRELLHSARECVRDLLVAGDGPSLEFHAETFGW